MPLEKLVLAFNRLTGTLPSGYFANGTWEAMTVLDLTSNALRWVVRTAPGY